MRTSSALHLAWLAGCFAGPSYRVPPAPVPIAASYKGVADWKVALEKIMAGHDHGEWLEVVSGVTGGELIVDNPSDSIAAGQQVRLAQPRTKPAEPQAQR